jgi:hypothetical protein
MENLTEKQQKHKEKIELLSRLIDNKVINLKEALLLLSNTEDVVESSDPSIDIKGPATQPKVTPYYYYTSPNTIPNIYCNTGIGSTLSQRINGGDTSGKMTTDEILQDYLQKVDSQE